VSINRVLAVTTLLLGGCAATTPAATAPYPPPALDVELRHDPDMDPIVPAESGRGRLMGSGVGQVHGLVEGTVRWTLFEVQSATSCELQLVGVITNAEGEELRFEAIGYGNRPRPSSSRWDMTASAAFSGVAGSDSPLAGRVGAWVGFFDARTGRHQYRVHLPAPERVGS